MQRQLAGAAGFTLLELVIMLVLISVLATTATSRFFSTADLNARSQRDTLLQLSRQLQLRSMQDVVGLQSRCPLLYVSASVAAITTGCNNPAAPQPNANDPRQITPQAGQLQSDKPLPLILRFDSKGQPTGACSAGCVISLNDATTAYRLCVAASGYIRAC